MSLILISNPINKNARLGAIPRDLDRPRIDYIEIAKRLDAQIIGLDLPDTSWHRGIDTIEQRIKLRFQPAFLTLSQITTESLLLSTSEKTAIPLALLLAVKRQYTPHIVIAHKLSSGIKTLLFRVSKLQNQFENTICVCQSQADYAIRRLGIDQSKVDFIYDKVDHHFFSPVQEDPGNYILAVGQEQRDYKTLVQAVAGTDINVLIVKSSPWSYNHTHFKLTDNVTVLSNLAYLELRQLYAGARLVVVPLYNVDYAAGVNTVLEAMAMAKPVIVTQSLGISDYIIDSETGCYVPSQDVQVLRHSILNLWQSCKERDRLGTNARQAVETSMNLDIYIDKVIKIIQQSKNSFIDLG